MPGYLPSFPENSVTPTISADSGDTAFSVDSLTGFSLNGPLSGKKDMNVQEELVNVQIPVVVLKVFIRIHNILVEKKEIIRI